MKTDGDYHDALTIAAALPIGWLAWHLLPPGSAIALTAAHILGGLWLSPDLDLPRKGRRCKAWHRWRRVGLGWFWNLYPGMVGKHRSWLSHYPILGTAGRLAYLSPLWLPVAIASPAIIPYLPPIAIGVELAAIVHYWRDWS